MNAFILASEITRDVPKDSLDVLEEMSAKLSHLATPFNVDGIATLGIGCIIMNPEICPPFKGGSNYLKEKSELNIRLVIDFADWVVATLEGRRRMIITALTKEIKLGAVARRLSVEERTSVLGLVEMASRPPN